AVQIVQRHILSRIKDLTFFTLSDANKTIHQLLEKLNNKPMQKKEGSRYERFLKLDKPYLQPLPAVPYECATWKTATVGMDYHVSVNNHFYSVPYTLVSKEVQLRISQNAIEVLYNGERVAAHLRKNTKYKYSTNESHRPPNHAS